jgi:hypothetical protein
VNKLLRSVLPVALLLVLVTHARPARADSTMVASGVVTFGVFYGAAVVAASISDNPADDALYVPLIGPWIDLADRGDCQLLCEDETRDKILIALDGVMQTVGAAIVVYGILTPTRGHVYSSGDVRIVPVSFGKRSAGLGITGWF